MMSTLGRTILDRKKTGNVRTELEVDLLSEHLRSNNVRWCEHWEEWGVTGFQC